MTPVVIDASAGVELAADTVRERGMGEPWPGFDQEPMLELHLDRVLITLTEARDGLPAGHTVWTP